MRWVALCLAVGCGRYDFEPTSSDCWPGRMRDAPYANSSEAPAGTSAASAFVICTPDQLAHVGEHPEDWASWFRLAHDLDLAGRTAPMIGDDTTPFTGTFDGGGHAISHLTYDLPMATTAVALFPVVYPGGRIANLSLHAVDILGNGFVGAVVGHGQGLTLDSITVDGRVAGTALVGGVIGGAECYQPSQAGAPFCGSGNVLANLTAEVDVMATGGSAGGIVGYTYADGMAPLNQLTALTMSGSVSGDNSVGGIVGDGEAIALDLTTSSATVTATQWAGGLAGDTVYSRTVISRSSASGSVTCSGGSCGGIVGDLEGSLVADHASGRVTCGTDGCGGLAADVSESVVECYATGDVSGRDDTGGLVGVPFGKLLVRNSYATGTVRGHDHVGGLIGQATSSLIVTGMIADCYATGTVTGNDAVGGLIGLLGSAPMNPTISLLDSFAIGSVSGASSTNQVSSVVGAVGAMYVVTGAFYAGSCVNALGSCATVGTQMPPSYFFSRANDPLTRWDFTTIWQEVPAGFPELRAP